MNQKKRKDTDLSSVEGMTTPPDDLDLSFSNAYISRPIIAVFREDEKGNLDVSRVQVGPSTYHP